MNILTDELPGTVEIDGRAVRVNSDFRSCLRIVLAFEDPGLTPQEKQAVMLANLYPIIPQDPAAALQAAAEASALATAAAFSMRLTYAE